MTDFDLPPHSSLPEGVRDAALTRVRAGLAAPTPRRLPLKITAVAVAVVTAAAVAVQLADRGDPTATAASTATATPELRHQDPVAFYDLRTDLSPAELDRRCTDRLTGLPHAYSLRLLARASRNRVELAVIETSEGIAFCETTPTSVTVSPLLSDPGTFSVAFTTATGSMAGFTGSDPRPFTLTPRDRELSTVVARAGRVFLMPNGFVSDGVTARPEVTTSAELVQEFELATPPLSGTVVDRPAAPQDRDSAEGRRLGECLVDQPQPLPDAPAWRAGRSAALSATGSVQLGHYDDLLLVCRQDRTVVVVDLRRPAAPEWAGMLVSGRTVRGVWVFHDFVESTQDGAAFGSSDSEALVAEVTDPRVATVTLTAPGRPDVTAEPVLGSVVLAGAGAEAVRSGQVRITARDASGAVLEEITP